MPGRTSIQCKHRWATLTQERDENGSCVRHDGSPVSNTSRTQSDGRDIPMYPNNHRNDRTCFPNENETPSDDHDSNKKIVEKLIVNNTASTSSSVSTSNVSTTSKEKIVEHDYKTLLNKKDQFFQTILDCPHNKIDNVFGPRGTTIT